MSLLVGVSGAQSSGKSTFIKALSEHKNIHEDPFKVSRYVQSEIFKVDDLKSAIADPVSMIAFQEIILRLRNEKNCDLIDMQYAQMAHDVSENYAVLSERTFADIATYASHWARKEPNNVLVQNWIHSYVKACKDSMGSYDLVFYLPAIIPFEADKNRADLDTRNSVDVEIKEFIKENVFEWHEIKSLSVEDRVQEALSIIANRIG